MLIDKVEIDKSEEIDIFEEKILKYSPALFELLLKDKTTGKNILWGTDDYKKYGNLYDARCEIKMELITGFNSEIIQPRATKEMKHQSSRTKEKAEVFTPSWVCNKQNNLVDREWFGRIEVFNIENEESWETIEEKIFFPEIKGKSWKDYIDARRMEISCGEAPYLVSRYDTVTGEKIEVKDRVGLLDRKLRIVNENTDTKEEWLKWTIRAFESIYGFEFQGDNLLLARENLLYTFIDNYEYKWHEKVRLQDLKKIANIIAWNLWQMNGITYTIPYAEIEENSFQLNIFEVVQKEKVAKYCKIKDWRAGKTTEYRLLIRGE
ncbi:restriction endonuclease subunit M [uncultured Fusobacterium sp.]|uniref:restriction endonuclease subunit M n=1 Tax=uncultured Fusobacterium sp. TaxID=159267 RepID=UPI0025D06D4D|nr:restriction endonuclease subunit M [uncultured Fusobacterium sp.]